MDGLFGGEKINPLLNGCGDNRDGGVDRVSFVFDFDVFDVNEDKKEGGNDGDADDRGFGGGDVWRRELNVDEFSSILIDVLEFDKSIGIDETDCSILLLLVVVIVANDSIDFSWIEGGGLDDAVLAPLVVGLTLRLEQLSPVSSSTPFRTKVFSSDIELVSSSSLTLVDDDDGAPLPVSWTLSVDRFSSDFDGGASGILNESDLVAAFGVTVVYVPRRFPFRRILSAGSKDKWFDCTWTDAWEVVDEVDR